MQVSFKIIIISLIFFSLAACIPRPNYNDSLVQKPKKTVRVVTYNILWGKGTQPILQPEETLTTIKATRADILLLQEVTKFWQQQLKQSTFYKIYPYHEFRYFPNAGGFAILAKYPFKTIHHHFPGFGWHPVWIVQMDTPLGLLQIANVHLTPSLESEGNLGLFAKGFIQARLIRKKEVEYIHKQLHKSLPIIIAGDFNEGDIGSAVKYLQRQGFQDAFKVTGNRDITWQWRFGPFHFIDRFDRFFYTNPLQLVNLQVLHKGSSDHYPVIADFKYNKPKKS